MSDEISFQTPLQACPAEFTSLPFLCDDIHAFLHLSGKVNSGSWNGYPDGAVQCIGVKGMSVGHGSWIMTMRFIVDRDKFAMRISDGESELVFYPYRKADFAKVVPPEIVLVPVEE